MDSDHDDSGARDSVVLGGGCFWCLEAIYDALEGVERVVSGYAGGHDSHPTYEEVCRGTTGHAEVVEITFDPGRVQLADLLRLFFTIHDPTTLDRQGMDVGSQYRSVIFCRDAAQGETAHEIRREIERAGIWDDPIVTHIAPLELFHPAEAYHQRYFEKHPEQPYCRVVIAPKVAKFRAQHPERLKPGA